MVLPNKWGQGQLFAFSALDGYSPAGDDFAGILSADKIGIRFFSKVKRELAVFGLRGVPQFEAVTGDLIAIKTEGVHSTDIVYADTHLIVGTVAPRACVRVLVEGCAAVTQNGDVEIQDTRDGDVTALCCRDGRFAFAFAHTSVEALALVIEGIARDVAAEKEKKLAVFRTYTLPENDPYAAVYAKCVSTMKTQLYSPEGPFKRIWSTPDRLPHKHLWLWDSVFHAVGFRNLNGPLAEDLILAVLDAQHADGFISHMVTVKERSAVTQPPVIAWGAYTVYQKTGNKAFLKTVYDANARFLAWCRAHRRDTEEELYTWLTDDDANCRCGESGMDNSPRFDTKSRLQAIDFSCFMANDVRYMARIAEELGDSAGTAEFTFWFETIAAAINQKLWCEEDGFYYDYDLTEGHWHRVQSVASFLPLFAGVCDAAKATSLLGYLNDPAAFNTEFPVPSISKKDATFGSDMWRGPVWMNYNYMIISGLADYGFSEKAEELTVKTVRVLDEWYQRRGTLYEFYDCENQMAPHELYRKGAVLEPYDFTARYQSVRDYGWTNTLLLDLLHNRKENRQKG